jgi:hypothetical protein
LEPKREELPESLWKLHRVELPDLDISPLATTVVATRKTKWALDTKSTEVEL